MSQAVERNIINGTTVNTYEVNRSLWKGMAVANCLYESEISYYQEGDVTRLEKTQNILGRVG